MPRFMLPLIALTILAACGDAPTKESPVPNVAAKPAASTAQTPSAAKKPAATATLHARSVKPSTVCTRYRARLLAAQTSATANPGSVLAKTKVKSLQTLVTDACE
jgi:hypothetical protein